MIVSLARLLLHVLILFVVFVHSAWSYDLDDRACAESELSMNLIDLGSGMFVRSNHC